MARILWTSAPLCEEPGDPGKRACGLARRAFAAAYNEGLKQELQDLIDRLCPTR